MADDELDVLEEYTVAPVEVPSVGADGEGVASGAVAAEVSAVDAGTAGAASPELVEQVANATVERVRSAMAEDAEGSSVVVLDDAQWSYLHDNAQVTATGVVLGLLLVAMLLGVCAARFLVDGWRR